VLTFGSNVLLDGPAGVGKSSYLIALSQKLGSSFTSFSCAASNDAGMDLIGTSSRWANGKPGKLHETLVTQGCPNPIILLDEIEKAIASKTNNIVGTLFGLLEKNNAKIFRDEFIDVPMDASMINWFATSNDASVLTDPIRDRFVVLQVRAPNHNELRQMIPNIYRDMVVEKKLEQVCAPNLSQAVIRRIAGFEGVSIRLVKRMIEDALGNMLERVSLTKSRSNSQKLRGRRLSVRLIDLPDWRKFQDQQSQRKRMGFIW